MITVYSLLVLITCTSMEYYIHFLQLLTLQLRGLLFDLFWHLDVSSIHPGEHGFEEDQKSHLEHETQGRHHFPPEYTTNLCVDGFEPAEIVETAQEGDIHAGKGVKRELVDDNPKDEEPPGVE